eukprot:COSAG03_NODE_266_length_9692_cov_13.725216_6_plen_126_part_00
MLLCRQSQLALRLGTLLRTHTHAWCLPFLLPFSRALKDDSFCKHTHASSPEDGTDPEDGTNGSVLRGSTNTTAMTETLYTVASCIEALFIALREHKVPASKTASDWGHHRFIIENECAHNIDSRH